MSHYALLAFKNKRTEDESGCLPDEDELYQRIDCADYGRWISFKNDIDFAEFVRLELEAFIEKDSFRVETSNDDPGAVTVRIFKGALSDMVRKQFDSVKERLSSMTYKDFAYREGAAYSIGKTLAGSGFEPQAVEIEDGGFSFVSPLSHYLSSYAEENSQGDTVLRVIGAYDFHA